jgi:hypothetical protein
VNVTLPNGVVLKDVPDGTSREDIKRKAIAGGFAKAEDFGDQTPAMLRRLDESLNPNDPVFYGLPNDVVLKIKTQLPDIQRKPDEPEYTGFDSFVSASPWKERQSEQKQLADIERLRIQNPEIVKMIEGMSLNEVDQAITGHRMSNVWAGIKRLSGQLSDEDISQLQEREKEFGPLRTMYPGRAMVGDILTDTLMLGRVGAGAAGIENTALRVPAVAAVGATAGIPSLGRGESKEEALKQAATGAVFSVALSELPRAIAARIQKKQLVTT